MFSLLIRLWGRNVKDKRFFSFFSPSLLQIKNMSTTKLTNKQKLNLECLAEGIQVFITTSAKPGKNIKCTSKKSEVKNLLVAEEQFAI